MEILKNVVYILATFLMIAIVTLVPEICTAVSVFYVLLLTTYLGIDVYEMIRQTKILPAGEFKKIKPVRFILCLLAYIYLDYLCLKAKRSGVDMGGSLTIFSSSLFIVIAVWYGALEGNKAVTGTKEE